MSIDKNSDDYLKSRFKQGIYGDEDSTTVERDLRVYANDPKLEANEAPWIRARTMP